MFGVLLAVGVAGGLAWAALAPDRSDVGGDADGAGPGAAAGTAAAPGPAATIPPTVAFSAPGIRELISGPTTVSVTATGTGLVRVRVTVDETAGPVAGETTATGDGEHLGATFLFDPSDTTDGEHRFIASAITSAGVVATSGRGFVVDRTRPSVRIVGVDPEAGLYVGKDPRRISVTVRGTDTIDGKLRYSALVRTEGGSVLRRFAVAGPVGDTVSFEWDGRDARGKVRSPGTYVFVVSAKDQAALESEPGQTTLTILSLTDIARRFSGARAKEHSVALARIGVRRAGTADEARAARYVSARFAEYGYRPSTRSFRLVNGASSRNVIATKRGASANAPIVVIGAHMDSIDNLGKRSVGGNDDASGVGVVLEAARVMAGISTTHELRFVAFGAEERIDSVPDHHHAGSRVLAAALSGAEMRRGVRMVNLDMVGVGYRMGIGTQSGATRSFADYHLATASRLGYAARYVGHGSGSDHEAFVKRGIPVAYYDFGPDPHYHTARDTAERLQVSALTATGRTLVGSLYRLAAR